VLFLAQAGVPDFGIAFTMRLTKNELSYVQSEIMNFPRWLKYSLAYPTLSLCFFAWGYYFQTNWGGWGFAYWAYFLNLPGALILQTIHLSYSDGVLGFLSLILTVALTWGLTIVPIAFLINLVFKRLQPTRLDGKNRLPQERQ
jgi:hypothetical protein